MIALLKLNQKINAFLSLIRQHTNEQKDNKFNLKSALFTLTADYQFFFCSINGG